MKKTGRAIFLAVAAMLCCTFGTAFAAGAEPNSEDDFEFSVNDDFTEITITGYTGTRTDMVIPASIQDVPVVHIGSNAFSNNNRITSVVIPEGVKEIADRVWQGTKGAFAWCSNLQSVTLPAGIYIGEASFSYCRSLETVVLGENSTIGEEAFESCSSLKSIDIPKGCTLRTRAFEKCENLESVVLPEDLKVIPDECFSGCKKLAGVTVPSSLKAIGSEAFYGCPIPSVDVPDGVIYMGAYAFYPEAITSLSLPKSLKWVVSKKYRDEAGHPYHYEEAFIWVGDNIRAITIPEGLKLFVLKRDSWNSKSHEYSSDAREIIKGAAIDKSIKLQKQLAALETTVIDACKASGYHTYNYNNRELSLIAFNHNKELFDDLLKAGLSEEEAKTLFYDNNWGW